MLNFSANQHKDGDTPVESIVTCSREQSRKGIVDGLGKFIEVDNHHAWLAPRHEICQGGKTTVYS